MLISTVVTKSNFDFIFTLRLLLLLFVGEEQRLGSVDLHKEAGGSLTWVSRYRPIKAEVIIGRAGLYEHGLATRQLVRAEV